MTELEQWLMRASKCLSAESHTRVRAEILDHYEASRDEAIGNGATLLEAEAMALRALGDPGRANRLYRQSLLTSSEAKLLRQGNWEARAVCSRPVLKWIVLGLPVAAFLAGIIALLRGATHLAAELLPIGLCFSVLLHGPFLPIYTPLRSRIYRGFKWAALSAIFLMAMWPLGWSESWLFFGCLWMVVWIEWRRFSIRRKLPIGQWPRQLHF